MLRFSRLKLSNLLLLGILAFLIVVPVSANVTRIALLMLMFGIGVLEVIRTGRLNYPRWGFVLSIITISVGCIWATYGLVRGNPGALFLTSVYIVWPLVYIALSARVRSTKVFPAIHNTIVGASAFIALFTVNFMAVNQGLLPSNPLNAIDLGQAANNIGSLTELRLYSISSLIFVVPYLVTWLLWQPVKRGRRYVVTALVTLGVLWVAFVSGRRALMLTMVAAPLLMSLVWWLLSRPAQPPRQRRSISRQNLILLTAAIFLSPLLMWGIASNFNVLQELYTRILSGFSATAEGGARVRAEQTQVLLSGWSQSPLYGSGLGAVTNYVRSDDQPWAFEMQYPMMLFQFGLLGFAVYVLAMLTVFVRGLYAAFRAQNSGLGSSAVYLVAALSGLLAFVLANSSNPYFQAFGHLWVLFLPIGMIHAVEVQLSQRHKPSSVELARPHLRGSNNALRS